MSDTGAYGVMNDKSYNTTNTRVTYCTKNTVRLHPLQQKLMDKTLEKSQRAQMLGAPEALQLCSNLIRLIKGKRCLDVGLFTGASALAWALAVPEDGEVISMDVSSEQYDQIGREIVESDPEVKRKIHTRIQPAIKTLDELIAAGEAGKFDFAFIDADKPSYPDYYEKCLTLLRPGGVIAIDNALMGGIVYGEKPGGLPPAMKPPHGGEMVLKEGLQDILNKLNEFIHGDDRVDSALLGMADGVHLAFKK